MASNRIERANSQIQQKLSEIITEYIQDPRIAKKFITITYVKTTPDFKYAKIGISSVIKTSQEQNEIVKVLKKSSGFIKHKLAEVLDMPYVPDLEFIYDKGAEYSERINQVLSTLEIPKEESGEDNNSEN